MRAPSHHQRQGPSPSEHNVLNNLRALLPLVSRACRQQQDTYWLPGHSHGHTTRCHEYVAFPLVVSSDTGCGGASLVVLWDLLLVMK